jgi:hypothetical protein
MITASGHTSEMRRNAPRVVKRSGIQKSIKLGQVALAKKYVGQTQAVIESFLRHPDTSLCLIM